jgi:hypothetical protein
MKALMLCGFLLLFYLREEEEPVDQKKYLEERCKPSCVKPLYEYEVSTLFLLWKLQSRNVSKLLFDVSHIWYGFLYDYSSVSS